MSDVTGRDVIAGLNLLPNPEAIDRTERVRLGGVEQFVSIRGRDAGNPVLVVCHGGPATPALPSAWMWQRGVEEVFTVVNYDQRASGRSDAPAGDLEDGLQLERYVDDLVELIAWLRAELGCERVALLGHSWGSVIGLTVAERHPELLWCYLGVGQVVSGLANEKAVFAYAKRRASEAGDDDAVQELAALEPYPGDSLTLERIVVCRKWSQHYGGLSAYRDESHYFFAAEDLSPYYTDDDTEAIGTGQQLTGPVVIPQLLGFEARDRLRFEVPMFQFLGRHDATTAPDPVADWFERVDAPVKRAIWFEHSAHLCMIEEPGRFLLSLVDTVLPVAHS